MILKTGSIAEIEHLLTILMAFPVGSLKKEFLFGYVSPEDTVAIVEKCGLRLIKRLYDVGPSEMFNRSFSGISVYFLETPNAPFLSSCTSFNIMKSEKLRSPIMPFKDEILANFETNGSVPLGIAFLRKEGLVQLVLGSGPKAVDIKKVALKGCQLVGEEKAFMVPERSSHALVFKGSQPLLNVLPPWSGFVVLLQLYKFLPLKISRKCSLRASAT